MVSMETCYKFDIVETKDAVQNAFDNAGLLLALRQATNVVRILVDELRETRQEYKNYVAKTEKILLGIKEYRKQDESERKKISKDVVEYWLEKATTPIQPVKNKTVVFFSADNELYCEPKSDHCYRLETNSYRDRMIRTLIVRKTYVPTKSLIEISGFVSRKSLESAVQAMNRIAHKKLNIEKLIDGYQDSGYRIDPDIILKKE